MADADVDGAHIKNTSADVFLQIYASAYLKRKCLYSSARRFSESAGAKSSITLSRTRKGISILQSLPMRMEIPQRSRFSVIKVLVKWTPEQLWGNYHGPRKTYHYQKVEMEDAMRADEVFTILMGDKVEPRREFIEKNAKFVKIWTFDYFIYHNNSKSLQVSENGRKIAERNMIFHMKSWRGI